MRRISDRLGQDEGGDFVFYRATKALREQNTITTKQGGFKEKYQLSIPYKTVHKTVFPENIIPIFQPPYSPELNPIERFWEELKRELKWENCENLDELREKVSQFFCNLESEAIAS